MHILNCLQNMARRAEHEITALAINAWMYLDPMLFADHDSSPAIFGQLKYLAVWRPDFARRILPDILQVVPESHLHIVAVLEFVHIVVAQEAPEDDEEQNDSVCISTMSFCCDLLWDYTCFTGFWTDMKLQLLLNIFAALMSKDDYQCGLVRSCIEEWAQELGKLVSS